jgi:cell division protein DivIC
MKILQHIPSWLRSKYLITLAGFAAIMLFLDKNDLFTQAERRRELRELRQNKDYYTKAVAAERKELEALRKDPSALEKYAREKYMMKRDNEDLFIVPEKSEKP